MNCIVRVTETQENILQKSQFSQRSTGPTSEKYKLAMEYIEAGISVIPIRLDGSKGPAIPSWKEFENRIATPAEIATWFQGAKRGIGIVCGIVSGGIEVIDFDDGTLFYPWFELVPSIASKLTIIETPSDGYHCIFRCSEIGGNRKIAIDPKRTKQTLIETRGQGGYIIGVGSPLGVHERKDRTYIQVMGPTFPDIPTITPQERVELWKAARSFTQAPIVMPKPPAPKPLRIPAGPAEQVIDRFNRSADWARLLAGWTSRDGIHWTRPGKSFGVSAKVCQAADGTPLLSVFSNNAGPLTPDAARATSGRADVQSYSPFEVLVRLQFNGDRKAAFKAIKEGQA